MGDLWLHERPVDPLVVSKAGLGEGDERGDHLFGDGWHLDVVHGMPGDSRPAAAALAAAAHWGSVGIPPGACAMSPIRSAGGVDPVSWEKGRAGGGALYQARGSGPEIASTTAAESATVLVTTPSTTPPSQLCASRGTRPRLGFRPTSPQYEAGMRIEPPPSLAWAMGNIPAATAHPAPPLEPPGDRAGSQGLRVIPWRVFSLP